MRNTFLRLLPITLSFLFILMPISSYADDENFENDVGLEDFSEVIETSSKASEIPTINARHAVIFDRNSKHTIYGKKANEFCKMASTTKIMTAIVVLENSNLNDIAKISNKSARTGGSRLGLSTNDEISVENLLYGLMMESGNDAAVALAEHVGGSVENFASMMNKKAKEIGLTSTNFVTPHGLDNDGHYTTAFDLAYLTDYALQNETFAKIVRTQTYTITLNGYPKTLSNTNELLGNFNGVYGVKTGFTNGANRCLVTSCKRGDLDVICVVLGCDTKKDRTKDSINLLNYAFNNFTLVNVKDILVKNFEDWSVEHKNSFWINKGVSQNFELYLNDKNFEFSNIAVNKTDIDKIYSEIAFDSFFEAPVAANRKIGEITLKIGDTPYFSIDILNKNSVAKKNTFDYVVYIFKNYCSFFSNFKINL